MENKYLIQKEKKLCNGCGICAKVCPKNAINMIEDERGFLYPEIDESKCIKCNKCKKICSNYSEKNQYNIKAYMAINKNDSEIKNSASGGMFFILAKYVIEKNGVVFGVKFNDELLAEHDYAEKIEDCKKFQGSKYVRSNTKNSFEEVKKFLDNNRLVLFTGTPCQCKALKVYLNKEYTNLILCDIICHANPSPKIFKKYIEELEKIKNKKIVNIQFRSKENGWRNQTPIIYYEDGSKQYDDTFYRAFTAELLSRQSCNECQFVSKNRETDFTIGDFWGIEELIKDIDESKGISLLLINSIKAEEIFDKISQNMNTIEVDLDKAISRNHHENISQHPKTDEFYNRVNKNESVIKLMKKYSKLKLMNRLKRKIKHIIKQINN